ncbi:MAG: LysR substrate-binding domain-containing protein [Betaproteobacteria bacterium]
MTINIASRDLRGFLALAETRHFRLAAERCRLSQPAFSQLIQRVEAATAARLFERSTRQVTLTSEGEVLVAAARRILEDIDSALADLRDHAARRKGRVAVAALPSLAAGILPGLLAGYRRRHPGVAIELFDVLSDRCVALVREGRADFAVAAAGPNLSEFETRPLAEDGFHLVCRRDHALAGRRRISLRDLAGCALIHLARTSSVRQHLDPVLREARHASTGLEVEQLPTVAALVSKGLGVSLVPTLTLAYFRQPDLVSVPLAAPGLSRRILAVVPRGRSLSPAAQELLGLIEADLAPARRARR